MRDRLIQVLIQSKNEAADDLLIEALRIGNTQEQALALEALFRRNNIRGLCGMIGLYEELPEEFRLRILRDVKLLHHALREAGRSDYPARRLAAMKLIALGRQGKLAYVLSENLHAPEEEFSKAAAEAMVALARWVATETHRLQRGPQPNDTTSPTPSDLPTPAAVYAELMEQRPEIEAAVARAMDVHRGKHGQDLSRAGMLLCDWPGSKTLATLHTAKHGGQSSMVRKLQQPPSSEQVEAFLLGASHGQLRNHFGNAFAQIDEAPVLDAMLRKTHWLKDQQLQICMRLVTRGVWLGESELMRDIDRRAPEDAARVGDWIACTGVHDVLQDEKLIRVLDRLSGNLEARVHLFRIASTRKRGASVALIKRFLSDPDERLVRMAAREIIRRRPSDGDSTLLQLMTSAAPTVRRVISRAIGHVGFDQFWTRFDRVDRNTRKQAGRAMLKLLPDAPQRLSRRLVSGPAEQRIKALQIVHELGLAESLRQQIMPLCSHANAKVRSKAVAALGDLPSTEPDVVLDRVLHDADARVRSNAIEVLEGKRKSEYVPLLADRARSAHNRERANAIKALSKLKVSTAAAALSGMLKDHRSEHRISAMWALRQIGWWQMLNEVGQIAKTDENLRVRRYALGVLKGVAELAQAQRLKAGA
jgi:HEAT repeat protein